MRIHSVFTEAVELIHAEDYPALSAKDPYNREEDSQEGIDNKSGIAALLAVCRRQNFNAFVPIITTKCFLRPSTLDLFIQSPTYHFATSLLLHFPDSPLMAEKPRSYAEDKFVEFSKPLRFLKNVRFSITIYDNFDVSSLVENHVLPLLFLENADIINLLPSLYKGSRSSCYCALYGRFRKMLIDRNEVPPFFHLLKHKRERVRASAALLLHDHLFQLSPHTDLLRSCQRTLIESDALEMLFRLIAGKVDDETAWGCYMKAAGSLCLQNSEIDFDQLIFPHLEQIEGFLRVNSLDLVYCAAYFLHSLIDGYWRSEAIAPKLVENGVVTTLVDVLNRDDDDPSHNYWVEVMFILFLISNSESCRRALVQPWLPSGEICFFAAVRKRLYLPLQYGGTSLHPLICQTLNNVFPIVDDNEINIDLFTGVLHANQQDSEGREHHLEIARCLSTCLTRRKKMFADDRAFFNFVSENRSGFLKAVSIVTSFYRDDHDESGPPGINERERNVSSEIVDAIAEVIEYEFFVFQCCNLKMKLIMMKTNGDENCRNVGKGIELFEAFANCRVDDSVYVMDIDTLANRAKSAVNQANDVHYHLDRLKQFFADKCVNEDAHSDEHGVPMPQELTRSIQDLAEARSILQRIDTDTIRREAEETKKKIMDQRAAEMTSEDHVDVDKIVLQVAKYFGKEHRLQDGQLQRLPSCHVFEEVDLLTMAQIEQSIRREHRRTSVKYTYKGPLNTVYRKCRGFYKKYKM